MDTHTFYGIFHVLVSAPLLIYVGLKGASAPAWMFPVLGALALGILAYHGWRAFQKMSAGKSAWVNWIHIVAVAPLFGWIALQGKETPRSAFEVALMLGFAALGYHGYYLLSA